jgi:pyridinium-3,5-biscarboxylic acid mononucleotide synthase
MDARDIEKLLKSVRSGRMPVSRALDRLRHMPFEDLGFAKIDHHRGLRQGFAEVIYAPGKTPGHIVGIVRGMLQPRATYNILITRADERIYHAVRRLNRATRFHQFSRAISIRRNRTAAAAGLILVITAGTSDISVGEEAAVTADLMGNRVKTLFDVGVAGIHRLLAYRRDIAAARVIICVAGMEGALPSVVAGLVRVPVIAVPTSTGYGASFGGLTALLGMLNSCASNVSVVNIDNGFGAGCVASTINRL